MKCENEGAMATFEGRRSGIAWSTRNMGWRNEGVMAMF